MSIMKRARPPYQPVGGKRQECLIGVYWTGLGDPSDNGRGHLVMRDMNTANLGFDKVPDPPFSNEEMQQILFAAKMQAIRCIHDRKKGKR